MTIPKRKMNTLKLNAPTVENLSKPSIINHMKDSASNLQPNLKLKRV